MTRFEGLGPVMLVDFYIDGGSKGLFVVVLTNQLGPPEAGEAVLLAALARSPATA